MVNKERCEYHDDIAETIKALTELSNTTKEWQAREEANRTQLYQVLGELQSSQNKVFDKLNDIEIELHREFATKRDLNDTKEKIQIIDQKVDRQVLKVIGIIVGLFVGLFGFVQWMFANIVTDNTGELIMHSLSSFTGG